MADKMGSEIELISEEEGRASLKETYADPDAAARFFDQMIEVRKKALTQFAEELGDDARLSEEFARNPIGMLNDRRLLGPLDQITLEGLRNPFLHWPWPWPICWLECFPRFESEIHWVCIGIWPLRVCWPVIHIHVTWVCRIRCL